MFKDVVNPGKTRNLRAILSEDGFFLMSAIDHLADFADLLPASGDGEKFEHVVRSKDRIARVLGEESSAVLLDPEFGIGHLGLSGAIPRSTGLVASIEGDDYSIRHEERHTTLRAGWDPSAARKSGAQAAKLLWYYRPDGNADVKASQLGVLGAFIKQCDEVSLPTIVEPIWNPLPGEDTNSSEWKMARVAGIVQSAKDVDQMNADVLKLEFPGYLGSPDSLRRAREACASITAAVHRPWVILSAGVSYEEFACQLEIAAKAGASGYLAGRSLWREAASARSAEEFVEAITLTRERIRKLNAITRAYARPYSPVITVDDALKRLEPTWYVTEKPDTAEV